MSAAAAKPAEELQQCLSFVSTCRNPSAGSGSPRLVTSCTKPWSTCSTFRWGRVRVAAHDSDALRIDPTYLGIDRSAAAFTIEITLNAGRTVELKKHFYATLVDRLNAEAHVRPQDVVILLTEVAKENWSFGNGEAQYA